jgi:hypothetical protein
VENLGGGAMVSVGEGVRGNPGGWGGVPNGPSERVNNSLSGSCS